MHRWFVFCVFSLGQYLRVLVAVCAIRCAETRTQVILQMIPRTVYGVFFDYTSCLCFWKSGLVNCWHTTTDPSPYSLSGTGLYLASSSCTVSPEYMDPPLQFTKLDPSMIQAHFGCQISTVDFSVVSSWEHRVRDHALQPARPLGVYERAFCRAIRTSSTDAQAVNFSAKTDLSAIWKLNLYFFPFECPWFRLLFWHGQRRYRCPPII